MSEPRDRPQSLPQSAVVRMCGAMRQRLDRVGIAIDLVPDRYERSCLREQQEQNSIDDGERLVECGWIGGARSRERVGQSRQRVENAIAQRPANAGCVRVAG